MDSHKLRYTGYIGDGDSKAHRSVVDAKHYGEANIENLECIGHVQKRLGTRLRTLINVSKDKNLLMASDCEARID